MKSFKSIIGRIGGLACSLAFFAAISSVNLACFWKFHQPKFPEALEKYKD